jgi:acetyltransferase-like isoleucine patch superfamily enzyme
VYVTAPLRNTGEFEVRIRDLSWKLRIRISSVLFSWTRDKNVQFGQRLAIIDGKWPIIKNAGNLIIGSNCYIRTLRTRSCLTVFQNANLKFGYNTYINDGANICASTSIVIGNNVRIADMVYIYDTDFHATAPSVLAKTAAVEIGDNVWIGANSMVLAGASIGRHSVIGAGSIVTGKIPPNCVAAGRPATVIKTFEAPEDWVRP